MAWYGPETRSIPAELAYGPMARHQAKPGLTRHSTEDLVEVWVECEYDPNDPITSDIWFEDENSEKLTELEEEKDDPENSVKKAKEVLQHRHHGEAPDRRTRKRWRRHRQGRSRKASKHARHEQGSLFQINIQLLRYSQESCKQTFQCGRSVWALVENLKSRKVSLSAHFLRLNVFETTDHETNEPVLRCINNRRLFALKEYAKESRQDNLLVNIRLFRFSRDTLKQIRCFLNNSDNTDGRDVRLRKGRRSKGSRAQHLFVK